MELRRILANPLLPPVLSKIDALPSNTHPNARSTNSRDAFLRLALGVVLPAASSSISNRGGSQHNQRGGNRGGGRGNRGRGSRGRGGFGGGAGERWEDRLDLTDDEVLVFREFASCVEGILKGSREVQHGLDWESEIEL